MANNFLTFTPTSTGTNLLTNGEYLAASDRTNGNQPGVASSKLVNKAIRQSSFITSQLAQFLSNFLTQDIIDVDGGEAAILKQMTAAFTPLAPSVQTLSGSGTYNLSYKFFITAGNATVGATYTNNAVTFTVKETIAGGTLLWATGSSAPAVSGTLTKASGTGDATLTFSAFRKPIALDVYLQAGAGGGSGGGNSGTGTAGSDGANSTFGTSLLTAGKGTGGTRGGYAGGGTANTINSPAIQIINAIGGFGGSSSQVGTNADNGSNSNGGGVGGASFFGGGGGGGYGSNGGGIDASGSAAPGSGGGGGSKTYADSNGTSGTGGGAGSFVRALIPSPSATYAFAIGSGGALGTAGTDGGDGIAGVNGTGIVIEQYQ